MYAMFAVVYICCRGRAVTNVVRTCSPTPLLKRQLKMFKLDNILGRYNRRNKDFLSTIKVVRSP